MAANVKGLDMALDKQIEQGAGESEDLGYTSRAYERVVWEGRTCECNEELGIGLGRE